ncbi:hypothetical protein HLB44_03375 [Aquincola sp. S2]|uniref:Lipoprotein n=1 Tax=Pseudaquabacterium terrae TaxID=2732868 RepID=A0ABX2EAB5_9BURK|nr:hypothetical protein [Aquabacterium terrae]NRF66024.1 hypothetical protein [Aquabacterium terrae]
MSLKTLTLAVACALLGACGGGDAGGPTAQPSSAPYTVTLQAGTPAVIAAEGLSLILTAVDDSRCPATALCIWAGEAVARVGIVQNGEAPAALALSTTTDKGTASYRSYRINLITVDPYPMTTQPIPLGEYRVSVRVDKA